jgi:cytochrome P450
MFSPYLLATDPKLIKQMFINDFRKFRNNDFAVSFSNLNGLLYLIYLLQATKSDQIISRNPFWMKDDAWKQKRSEVMPTMTPSKLKAVYPLIVKATKNLVSFISKEIEEGNRKSFDARDICLRYTCDSICSCTYGTDAQSFTAEDPFFFRKGQEMWRGIVDSVFSFWPKKMLPDEVEAFFIEISRKQSRAELRIRYSTKTF